MKESKVDSDPEASPLELRLADAIVTPGDRVAARLVIHLEVRNRAGSSWSASWASGPLLKITVYEVSGRELATVSRLCPSLSWPTRLEPDRAFLLPIYVPLPLSPPEGRFRVVVDLFPEGISVEGWFHTKDVI
jgi:hypothetical protein